MSTTATIPAPSTRNILRVFRQIPAAEVAEGREWYPRALTFAVELAESVWGRKPISADENDDWGREVNKAAAVIAVLSPRLSWSKNQELARLAYQLYSAGSWSEAPHDVLAVWPGLKANAVKAFRILGGEDPEDVVKGPKVRQFWHTIVDPTDPRAVVVDRHAFDVAVNRVLTDDVRGKLLGKAGAYDNVADKYRRAAAILSRELGYAGLYRYTAPDQQAGITPAELQAITWVWWRKNRAAANHG